jgi:hypothetical protein
MANTIVFRAVRDSALRRHFVPRRSKWTKKDWSRMKSVDAHQGRPWHPDSVSRASRQEIVSLDLPATSFPRQECPCPQGTLHGTNPRQKKIAKAQPAQSNDAPEKRYQCCSTNPFPQRLVHLIARRGKRRCAHWNLMKNAAIANGQVNDKA